MENRSSIISFILLVSWIVFAGYGCKDSLVPANGSSSGTEALKALEIASAAAFESVSQDASVAAAQAAFRDGTKFGLLVLGSSGLFYNSITPAGVKTSSGVFSNGNVNEITPTLAPGANNGNGVLNTTGGDANYCNNFKTIPACNETIPAIPETRGPGIGLARAPDLLFQANLQGGAWQWYFSDTSGNLITAAASSTAATPSSVVPVGDRCGAFANHRLGGTDLQVASTVNPITTVPVAMDTWLATLTVPSDPFAKSELGSAFSVVYVFLKDGELKSVLVTYTNCAHSAGTVQTFRTPTATPTRAAS